MSVPPVSPDDLARWRQLLSAWEQSGAPPLRCAGCQTDLLGTHFWVVCGHCGMFFCPQCHLAHRHTPPPS
jgi:hypothetical protein